VPAGDEQPVTEGQDRRREARVAGDALAERAQGRRRGVAIRGRATARDPATPQHVVDHDEGAVGKSTVDECIEIRAVLRLEGIDERQVERTRQPGVTLRKRVEGGGVDLCDALVGPWALFVWLRLIVGLVFPLVVSWAAVQTARTRSMESATGLLYINVGTIAAGTILAAGLYFGAGLLV
jgi:hypothetical protein